MTLSAGTALGQYEVITLIGAGGMGEVYRARDTRLGRDVALKILPDVFASDGRRFIMVTEPDNPRPVREQITVVINWLEELKRLAPH